MCTKSNYSIRSLCNVGCRWNIIKFFLKLKSIDKLTNNLLIFWSLLNAINCMSINHIEVLIRIIVTLKRIFYCSIKVQYSHHSYFFEGPKGRTFTYIFLPDFHSSLFVYRICTTIFNFVLLDSYIKLKHFSLKLYC